METYIYTQKIYMFVCVEREKERPRENTQKIPISTTVYETLIFMYTCIRSWQITESESHMACIWRSPLSILVDVLRGIKRTL